MQDVPKEDKAEVGQLLNAARSAITAALEEKQAALQDVADRAALAGIDVTLPAAPAPGRCAASAHADPRRGDRHPPPHGLRARRRSGNRGRVPLFRRPQHARRSPGAQREGHLLFRLRQAAAHPHLQRADPHHGNRRRRRSASSPPAPPTAATRSTPPTSRSSTSSKASSSPTTSRCRTSRARSSISSTNSSARKPKSVSARTSSRSPSRASRST